MNEQKRGNVLKAAKKLYKRGEKYAPPVVNPEYELEGAVLLARRTIREAFEADPEFKQTYIANIAMLLYNELDCGRPTFKRCKASNNKRNDIAEKILDLVFSK